MERFLRFCILNSCEESLVSSKILPPSQPTNPDAHMVDNIFLQ